MAAAVQIIQPATPPKATAAPAVPAESGPAEGGAFALVFQAVAPVVERLAKPDLGVEGEAPQEAEVSIDAPDAGPDPQLQFAPVMLPVWKLSLSGPPETGATDVSAGVIPTPETAPALPIAANALPSTDGPQPAAPVSLPTGLVAAEWADQTAQIPQQSLTKHPNTPAGAPDPAHSKSADGPAPATPAPPGAAAMLLAVVEGGRHPADAPQATPAVQQMAEMAATIASLAAVVVSSPLSQTAPQVLFQNRAPGLYDATAVLAEPVDPAGTPLPQPTTPASPHAAIPDPAVTAAPPDAQLPDSGQFFLPAATLGLPTATAPASPGPVAALCAQIVQVIATPTRTVTEVALAPVELGHVRLSLRHHDSDPDRIVVMMHFERPEVMDLFRRNADQLQADLRSAGYSGADLSFSHSGSGKPQDQPTKPGQWMADPSPPLPPLTPSRRSSASLDLRL